MYKTVFTHMRKVYDWLEDDLSKELFENYFNCRLHENWITMSKNASTKVQEQEKKFQEKKLLGQSYSFYINYKNGEITVDNLPDCQDESIVIYGARRMGHLLVERLKGHPSLVVADCYYETIPEVLGVPVISEAEAFANHPNAKYFIASWAYDILHKKLIENHIPESNIIMSNYASDNDTQYWDFFQGNSGEIFVDAGVFDGASSLLFTKWAKDFQKIYLFEPEESNFDICTQKLAQLPKDSYELFPVGLWDEKTSLCFDSDSSSSAINLESDSENRINVDTLDHLLQGKPVTYIKMDIEGAELKALHGAKETIQKHRPKLAICVYHKTEDMMEIPMYLKEILPEYRFALRHYSSNYQETVLYAWVDGANLK